MNVRKVGKAWKPLESVDHRMLNVKDQNSNQKQRKDSAKFVATTVESLQITLRKIVLRVHSQSVAIIARTRVTLSPIVPIKQKRPGR